MEPNFGTRFRLRFGFQIWDPNLDQVWGPKLWAPNLPNWGPRLSPIWEPKFGGQNFGPQTWPKLESDIWAQIWDPNLVPKLVQNLGPTFPGAEKLGPLFWVLMGLPRGALMGPLRALFGPGSNKFFFFLFAFHEQPSKSEVGLVSTRALAPLVHQREGGGAKDGCSAGAIAAVPSLREGE